MNITNIIHAAVKCGGYSVTEPLTKEDYGIILKIEGVELPESYQVDFASSDKGGTAITMLGDADGVLIPHQFIDGGQDVFAFLYLVGEDFGKTVYKFRIPNKVRPDRTDIQPTPEEQSTLDQLINELNGAVEQTSADVVTTGQNAQRAEDAKDVAVSAKNEAVSAKTAAQTAQTGAETAESHAQGYALSASDSASSASESASRAETAADNAEQSAAQSGYMWFCIEDGKLYLDRTPNTQVDFYMSDGKLYVEEVV